MKRIFHIGLALAAGAAILAAQPKQPQPKSQKEVEALMAIQNAPDADARIKAVEDLIKNFADTEFKAFAFQVAAASAQEKNDFEKMVFYAERALEVDPKNFSAMIMLAAGIPQRTREFDLDKEEKLGRAEKYAKEAFTAIEASVKPRPEITDEQWTGVKKDFTAQAHEALGMIALARKKYDEAIKAFKASIESAATPDPATSVRLAAAYNNNGNYDEAMAQLSPLLGDPQTNPIIKQFAQSEMDKAKQGKTAKK
jgi:tetratricopeptide (TPR) repeat protein